MDSNRNDHVGMLLNWLTLRYMWWTSPDSRGKIAKAPVRAMKSPKKGKRHPQKVVKAMYEVRVMSRTSML